LNFHRHAKAAKIVFEVLKSQKNGFEICIPLRRKLKTPDWKYFEEFVFEADETIVFTKARLRI